MEFATYLFVLPTRTAPKRKEEKNKWFCWKSGHFIKWLVP
jgi:hypothetical protein